jgi:alginate production protein
MALRVVLTAAVLWALPSAVQAQFQLPPSKPAAPEAQAVPAPEAPAAPAEIQRRLGAPPTPLLGDLKYQYGYGSESEAIYRRDRDLDRRLRDNSLIATPQLNAIVIYRPRPSLEMTLEMMLEREIPLQEETRVVLPSGEVLTPPRRRMSLLVDQAFVTFKDARNQLHLHAGRRNYEDDRHWLYDTSMDIAAVTYRKGTFRAEATAGREIIADLDLWPRTREQRDRIDTYMLYAEYRGIEDLRLGAYSITRHDRAGQEGRPWLLGLRARGNPMDGFNYWTELAQVRGRDETARRFSAYGFDAGFTYQYQKHVLYPSITLGYAFGSGDGNPNDGRNREFGQTGLQSNEVRMGGIPEFKFYGETLDPELSNLHILTLGTSFRPVRDISVDLVYHRYRLHKVAEELRSSELTAQMNQVDGRLSKDVGYAFDIVVGFRNLFGLKRLGLDVRAGWFRPGRAFVRDEGDEDNPRVRRAEEALAVIAKLWW